MSAGPVRFSRPPDWTEFALCAQTDPDSWFVDRGGDSAPAKAVCLGCTVREQCLALALDRREIWGVWGGLTSQERQHAARLIDDGQSVADIITAHDAAFYARADAAAEARERRRVAERDYRDRSRAACQAAVAAQTDTTAARAA